MKTTLLITATLACWFLLGMLALHIPQKANLGLAVLSAIPMFAAFLGGAAFMYWIYGGFPR